MADAIEEKANINPWLACLPTMASAFMFVLDETIANVALPHMAGSFSVSHTESTWVITSYLIASGIIITTSDFFTGTTRTGVLTSDANGNVTGRGTTRRDSFVTVTWFGTFGTAMAQRPKNPNASIINIENNTIYTTSTNTFFTYFNN